VACPKTQIINTKITKNLFELNNHENKKIKKKKKKKQKTNESKKERET
jgi:hypothetical protein